MKVFLWRILGNDVPPRHSPRQTEDILRFVLDKEPDFPNVEKVWLINRVYDDAKRLRLEQILRDAGRRFYISHFDWSVYRELTTEESKRLYITNVNHGRNWCVSAVQDPSGVCYDPNAAVAPFDGGIALRSCGMQAIQLTLVRNVAQGYVIVPMWRVPTFEDYLDETVPPCLHEDFIMQNGWRKTSLGEPQVLFLPGADIRFDEGLPWGMAPKVELLWRLRVPGIWDFWQPKLKVLAINKGVSRYAGLVAWSGFCCRLPSGNIDCEQSSIVRGEARNQGWRRIIMAVDKYRR